MSSYYPTFTRAEGAAYYRFSDMMRKLEWEIHHKFWRGEGLPEAWHEIATDHGPGPKERITLWVDKRTVKFFRATGKGWQTRMNLVLVAYAEARASGAVKGAERFRLDKSAEKHHVDGPPPAWGQTRADEEEMAAFAAARVAEYAVPDPCTHPDADPAPATDPGPCAKGTGSAEPLPEPTTEIAGGETVSPAEAPVPDDAPPQLSPTSPSPSPCPAETAAEAPPDPPAEAPPAAPARPLTPQEALRAQYEADSAAREAERKARLAPRPGETNAERLERLLYEYEAGKARYVEMKRQRGELKDVPEDWRTPRRR